jgi:hypothetical protein
MGCHDRRIKNQKTTINNRQFRGPDYCEHRLLADHRLSDSELAELGEEDVLRQVLRTIANADPAFDIELTGFPSDPQSAVRSPQSAIPIRSCPADSAWQAGKVPPGLAFLATTNLDIGNLTERLQNRFLPVRLQPPETQALAAFLARRWGVPIATTRMIAAGAAGNVRAAMADLELWMG